MERLAQNVLAALNDRVRLDQAIGMIAGAMGIDPAAAREVLERYARARDSTAHAVADTIAEGALDPARVGQETAEAD